MIDGSPGDGHRNTVKRYEAGSRRRILASVHCDNSEWVGRAKEILKRTGAEDIASTGEAGSDYGKADKPLARGVTSQNQEARDEEFATRRTRSGGGSL